MDISTQVEGMVVFRASRLEQLLLPLQKIMDAAPPAALLAPHELIAAHPGMRRWLGRELAVRAGPKGVAANLRIELPSLWMDRLASEVLGERVAARPWRRELLRWRIHEHLEAIDDERIRAYLAGDAASRARRRFQLADRLARICSQYLVYRPDWLAAWAAGHPTRPDGGFLATLWRRLHADIGRPHRGERVQALVQALDAGSHDLPREPVHVFGIAHLAPAELAVLQAVSRHRPVVLYVPDPCREHWGGLTSPLAALRLQVAADPTAATSESLFLDQGHPLLGAWGRMGQHFVLALDELEATIDLRAGEDASTHPPATRLEAVQESIRRFDPALIGEVAADPREDASLRVHACHTRLRELEVLRDALLQARVDDPTLRPADIVVMMPDIHAYLPLLPAVFGPPGEHAGPLPYHCADVAVARSHPLFEAFRRLLELPTARLSAAEITDLLALAPVATRLGLAEADIELLGGWISESRIAWALDAAARGRFGVPAIAEHTFAWGVERMLAGYLVGALDEGGDAGFAALELAHGPPVAPLAGVHGPQAALLGQLDRLLLELAEAARDAAGPRRASEWAARLTARIDALLAPAPGDAEGREAMAALRQFVDALASEPAAAGLDPELDFSVVREILLAQLDRVPARQRFLLGGVTFCGMVPQRAIPFRMVAVLGLNDGEFPRAGSDPGLDLMLRHPRLGDRDVRSDDRYLFLETLMSARWRLHLSYIGLGVHDGKPRNPAAPLAELMAVLDPDAAVPSTASDRAEGERQCRPWWVRHPLQPFDARYFDGSDPVLFSFDAALAKMRGTGAAPPTPFLPLPQPRSGPPVPPPPASVALSAVLGYFSDPARHLLESGLGLRLDALGEGRLRESEPLDPSFEALDGVRRRLFLQAARRHPHRLPDHPPGWLALTGLLPPGRAGEEAWQAECAEVQALLDSVAAPHPAQPLFAAGLPESRPLRIARAVDGWQLEGELRGVHETAGARWLLSVQPGRSEDALDFRARIGLFLSWALLRLETPATRAVLPALVCKPGKPGCDAWSRALAAWDIRYRSADAAGQAAHLADLEARIGALVAFHQVSCRQPQWYFPRTSWQVLSDPDKALAGWWGSEHSTGECDYAPGYARVLAGGHALDHPDVLEALVAAATHLHAQISLAPMEEPA